MTKLSKNQDVVLNDNFRDVEITDDQTIETPKIETVTNPLADRVTTRLKIAEIKERAKKEMDEIKKLAKLAKEEAKVNKPERVHVDSAYGVAVEEMTKNPELTFDELKSLCKERGFEKESAIRTAHVTVKKIVSLLKLYGWMI